MTQRETRTWSFDAGFHRHDPEIQVSVKRDGRKVFGVKDEATAAEIVRACNSHDALLAALKLLHDNVAEYARINNLGGFDNHDMRMARAAIAKAKATARAPEDHQQ